jgi:capsular exopolysaccharide synthesis family protein
MIQSPSFRTSVLAPAEMLLRDQQVHGANSPWRIFRRHRLLCVVTFAVVALLGITTLLLQQPQYSARTTIMVASRQPDLAITDLVANAVMPREPDVEGEIQLMISRTALLKVAGDLHLESYSDFAQVKRARTHLLVRIRESLEKLLPDSISGPPPNDSMRQQPAESGEDLVDILLKSLKVEQLRRSTTVEITYTSSDPVLAAAISKAIAENYISNRHAARIKDAEQAAYWLRLRVAELREQVLTAETSAEQFRAKSTLKDGRDLNLLRAEIEKVGIQLANARLTRSQAANKLAAVEARVKRHGPDAVLEAGESQLTDRLRQVVAELRGKVAAGRSTLGATHPDVAKLVSELKAAQTEVLNEALSRLERLQSDVTIADQQILMLEQSLSSLRTQIDGLSAAEVTFRALERQAAAYRTVYESFLGRVKVVEQVGYNPAQNWVVSAAVVPQVPISPNVPAVLGATLMIGIIAAAGMALFAEARTRRTILSAQQFHDRGLRPFGLVPDLGRRVRSLRRIVETINGSSSTFTEAMAGVYASVAQLAFRGPQPCLVLMISSALPLEGKSTTATALAAIIASFGKRVLLVDGDLRAPRLHQAFGLKLDRGLTDCLLPNRALNDSIHFDAVSGISLLPAGPPHPRPQNVLGSSALREALEGWRTYYDFIVFDTPPVLPVSDARVLGPMIDYCVFVARWGKSRWSATLHGLRLMEDSGIEVAGIVVSRVDVAQLATYEFADSDVYGKSYRRYAGRFAQAYQRRVVGP